MDVVSAGVNDIGSECFCKFPFSCAKSAKYVHQEFIVEERCLRYSFDRRLCLLFPYRLTAVEFYVNIVTVSCSCVPVKFYAALFCLDRAISRKMILWDLNSIFFYCF